jgi:hypothetical protein
MKNTLNKPAKQLREIIAVGVLKSARIIRSNYAALFSWEDIDAKVAVP